MLKIEESQVWGFEHAVRGARNPMNSWGKSDSYFADGYFCLGDNDRKLLSNLRNAGPDHGKFLRQIMVSMDITAPLYWWKEFDTYKVGTVANSCSTMHKIHAKEFTMDDFSCEHLYRVTDDMGFTWDCLGHLQITINLLNGARECYLKSKDKDVWWQMIQLLPTSYNQKRTVTLNYEVLRNMYHARKNHKLDEWHVLCDWIMTLPYAKELIVGE